MPYENLTDDDVLTAATALVAAFRATDTRAYFDSFAEDATFVFHTEQYRLDTRAAYEQLWAGWVAEGWRVTGCISSNQRVQLLGGTAVFTHDVETTTTTTAGVSTTTRERETIVFRRAGAGVVAVHEHLSPVPADSPEASAS